MEKKTVSPFLMGLAIGAVLIVFAIITTIIGIEKSQHLNWVQFVIIFGGVIGGCILYANQMNGNVSFGDVFAQGFKITAVMTCISIIYLALALTVIFPEIKEKTIEIAREQAMKQGNGANQAQMQKGFDMMEKFFIPFAIGGTLVLNLVLGAIAALIGAAVAKKNPNPVPFDQTGNS